MFVLGEDLINADAKCIVKPEGESDGEQNGPLA
jgi:hypothetical protein